MSEESDINHKIHFQPALTNGLRNNEYLSFCWFSAGLKSISQFVLSIMYSFIVAGISKEDFVNVIPMEGLILAVY